MANVSQYLPKLGGSNFELARPPPRASHQLLRGKVDEARSRGVQVVVLLYSIRLLSHEEHRRIKQSRRVPADLLPYGADFGRNLSIFGLAQLDEPLSEAKFRHRALTDLEEARAIDRTRRTIEKAQAQPKPCEQCG